MPEIQFHNARGSRTGEERLYQMGILGHGASPLEQPIEELLK
jgi:hypothetical protein